MGKPIEITSTNFQEVVTNSDKPVLVDFWAAWCGPCRAIAPVIEELATDYEGKAVIGKLDVDANGDVASEFGVRGIPALLIFKNGQKVGELVGVQPKSRISAKLEEALAVA